MDYLKDAYTYYIQYKYLQTHNKVLFFHFLFSFSIFIKGTFLLLFRWEFVRCIYIVYKNERSSLCCLFVNTYIEYNIE